MHQRADPARASALRMAERFRRLTGLSPSSPTVSGLPRAFLDQVAPAPDTLIRRLVGLERRTENALRRFLASRAPRAGPWTFRRLLEIRGFGLGALLDVLEALAEQR
jgi:hypothetical protein